MHAISFARRLAPMALLCASWPAVAEPIPPDPDLFLGFLNGVSPAHVESAESATAYYNAVDPAGARTTLSDWLTASGFDGGADAQATYVNDVDLGFGRHMFVKVLPNGNVSSYVQNYSDNDPGTDPVDGPPEEKIANAHNDVNLIATVAMEYAPPPSDPGGARYTSFYVFGPDGQRLLAPDLDGRGAKFVPGVCNTCHGGAPRPLLSDGSYPDNGDTGAGFLPWDLDSFRYSAELFDGQALYTRAAQEGQFKVLNEAVLETNPTPVVVELIEGWYGGAGLPDATFEGAFVPAGWTGHEATYLEAFAPNCRACHLMRNPAAGFSSYSQVTDLLGRAQDLVFDGGLMPLARRTYDKFWPDYDSADPDYTDLLGSVSLTRRPGGGAPVAFAGVDRPAVVGSVYVLDATRSRYATSFAWSVVSAPAGSVATTTDPTSAIASFVPDVPGNYEFELTATNSAGSTTARVKSLATSGVLTEFFDRTGVDFARDVMPLVEENCLDCHTAPTNGGIAPPFDEPLVSTLEETVYRNLSLRADASDPEMSLMLAKPTAAVSHGGGVVLSNPGLDYDKLLAWIAQGVRREVDADDDGLDDQLEPDVGTDPALADTDGDGYFDSVEVVYGSDPALAASVPTPPLRLSIDRSGWGGVNYNREPAVSADGRMVAFQSGSWNLVPGSFSNGSNVLIKDVRSGKVVEADTDCNCVGAGSSERPELTPDGRYVVYRSASVRLVDDDTNNDTDIFVTDLDTGATTRVSTDSLGVEGNGNSGYASSAISNDARYVAFDSEATNLVDNDNNFVIDVFLKDRDTGETTRVSTNSVGEEANADSNRPSISADSRYVAFLSQATNLVGEPVPAVGQVYVKDTVTGETTCVSTDANGSLATGSSFSPMISADGNYVVFNSRATNLVQGDDNDAGDVFLKNLTTGEVTLVSVGQSGAQGNGNSSSPTISADNRYVVFTSFASDLVANDGNNEGDIFVRDLVAGTTARVSETPDGMDINGGSYTGIISPDGWTVTFTTQGTNLGGGDDSNFGDDVYQVPNPLGPVDSDGDGIFDSADNCTQRPNADQRDSNGDGYGNACDADLNNDGIVNAADLGLLKAQFFATGDIDADLNGDFTVNAADLGLMKQGFFQPPGPSGIAP